MGPARAASVLRIFRACALLLGVLLSAGAARAECRPGSLLYGLPVHYSRGIEHPELLNDGRLAREGDPVTSSAATSMKGIRPAVEWDLGAPTRIVAAAVQADNNDTYGITVSLDGAHYTPLFQVNPDAKPGLRERVTRDLSAEARYVRFEAYSGDREWAATEVRVYCAVPEVWPPSRIVRAEPTPDLGQFRDYQLQSASLVIGLLAFPFLFVLFPRLAPRGKKRLAATFIVLGALSWIQFGRFIAGTPLHYWDMFHYFVGSKYYAETRYFDVYRCGAKALRELGDAALVDKSGIRDLRTNEIYPGDFTRTDAGRCRADFSPERWTAYKEDYAAFRGLFVGHTIPEAFSDHGFNATPPNAVWLRTFTRNVVATRSHLIWLAQLDSLALAGTVAAIGFGFGLFPATITALVLGLGSFWSFPWVGGCLGRHVWLFFAALGVSLAARERPFASGASLAVAGLLRLFPFAFVGGAVVWIGVDALRKKRIQGTGRRFLAGALLAFSLGNLATIAAVGIAPYREFAQVFDRHSHTPSNNQLGLTTLLSWTLGEDDHQFVDPTLTEPAEPWTHHQLDRRVERRPIWAAFVALSFAVVVLTALRGGTLAECAAVSGVLLFTLLPMTSYDYTWLVVLVALAGRRPRLLSYLLAFAVASLAFLVFGGEGTMQEQHYLGSIACAALLVYAADVRGLFRFVTERFPGGGAASGV